MKGKILEKISLLLACCLLSAKLGAGTGNSWPIVLVHGFTGWGPDEMAGYHYWGGFDDIAGTLTLAGHPTHVGVVGPLASNWDRACELYAYIKGGRVDYGAAHSERYNHKRFGRTFPGLLPDWGSAGENERVHLVGHSQGGQTIRVLSSLLAHGDADERAGTQDTELHPLFRGGAPQLVHSVTSLASPHDGSTLATMLNREAGYLLSWLLALVSYISENYADAPSYDFKLDQWNIAQKPGERDEAYRRRLADSHIWKQPDISVYDLRPTGASALNTRYPAVDSIYYFSWATLDTVPGLLGRGYMPGAGVNLALLYPMMAISTYRNLEPGPGLPDFDEAWWPNDGVVNTVSMSGPKLGSRDHIVNIGEGEALPEWQPGIWYFMGVLPAWDHLDIVGQQTHRDFPGFYLKLAQTLGELPAGTESKN